MTRRRMAAIGLSVLAFFAIAWRTARSVQAGGITKEEILQIDEERNQALQKGDIPTLERIYSDDLVYTNASGAILSKAEHLAELKKRTLHFVSFVHEDVQVTIHGDAAFLTGISKSKVEYRGEVSTANRRFLNVFMKKGAQWQCVAHMEANLSAKP
jgi:ketosteroid isomerase-like protein